MRHISRKIGFVLLMLLMAAFVVVPISDALACSAEPHSAASAPRDDAGDLDGKSDHEVPGAGCSHGHCHHANASLPLEAATPPQLTLPAVWNAHAGANGDAVVLDGLTRPPQG